jgi:hypothetical protein
MINFPTSLQPCHIFPASPGDENTARCCARHAFPTAGQSRSYDTSVSAQEASVRYLALSWQRSLCSAKGYPQLGRPVRFGLSATVKCFTASRPHFFCTWNPEGKTYDTEEPYDTACWCVLVFCFPGENTFCSLVSVPELLRMQHIEQHSPHVDNERRNFRGPVLLRVKKAHIREILVQDCFVGAEMFLKHTPGQQPSPAASAHKTKKASRSFIHSCLYTRNLCNCDKINATRTLWKVKNKLK